MNNAYIDNQNLFMATHNAKEPWDIDMRRLRIYLSEKYNVDKAYLFMGVYQEKQSELYTLFQNLGYILIFRVHENTQKTIKKGNVDTDLVFQCMKDVASDANLDKVILVSGDGDYYKMVKYLNSESKLEKVLLPSHKNASSLYKSLSRVKYQYLDDKGIKRKIGRRKNK